MKHRKQLIAYFVALATLLVTSNNSCGQEVFETYDSVGTVSSPNEIYFEQALPLSHEGIPHQYEGGAFPYEGIPLEYQQPAAETAMPWLRLSTDYTYAMLDFLNRQTDKETLLLRHAAASGGLRQVTLGAQFRGSALFGKTNTADKFPYLGRFPTDFEGEGASDFRLLQANQAASFSFAPMVHGHFETLFSDVFSFGSFNQGSFQVRQAYVVLGDFNRSPWYAFIGKKNVGFGDFGTLSPFTQPITWHYFAVLAEGAGVGYDNGLFRFSATALNGSRGIRVSDSSAKGDINNFAVNGQVRFPNFNADRELRLGAGYLHGTIYNATEAEHLNSDLFGPDNAAWNVNAYFRTGRLQLSGEYVQTVDPWPVTSSEVSAYQVEAAYEIVSLGRPARLSLAWGEGFQGEDGTEFEFNQQLIVGYQVQPLANVNLSLEYVRSSGFAPLIDIERVSDRDVIQDSIVMGATIRL